MTVCAAHRFIFCKGVFNEELQNDTSVIFRPLCRFAIYFSLAHTYVSSFGLSISWQNSMKYQILNRNLVHSNEGIPCNNQGSLIKLYEKMPACTFVPTCNYWQRPLTFVPPLRFLFVKEQGKSKSKKIFK